jgi:hypothetical protein
VVLREEAMLWLGGLFGMPNTGILTLSACMGSGRWNYDLNFLILFFSVVIPRFPTYFGLRDFSGYRERRSGKNGQLRKWLNRQKNKT